MFTSRGTEKSLFFTLSDILIALITIMMPKSSNYVDDNDNDDDRFRLKLIIARVQ